MAEPERLESVTTSDAVDRDSRAETLLLAGLDRYFAGQYEDAIHIWTRVLFLDRTHSRARAYIDRARTALAERQRRADELLEASYELLGQGRTTAARHLFNEVVAQAGEDERAAALRLRLERLEQFERLSTSIGVATAPIAVPPTAAPVSAGWPARKTVFVVTTVAAFALAAGAYFAASWFGWRSARPEISVDRRAPLPPPLSTSEVALIRAHTDFSRGRLAEALQALDRVNTDSPQFAEADRLRVRIQQTLLASSRMEARVP